VNEQKSKVDRPAKRKILGFRLFRRQGEVLIGVAPKAVQRCRERLRELTRRTRSGTLTEILNEINTYVDGWTGYFRLADTLSLFQELDEWLRRRLRQWSKDHLLGWCGNAGNDRTPVNATWWPQVCDPVWPTRRQPVGKATGALRHPHQCNKP
jgi:group II intron maturase